MTTTASAGSRRHSRIGSFGPIRQSGETLHLWALIKEFDGVCEDEIAGLEVPTARPLLYRLDAAGRPLVAGGLFLDGDTRAESEDADAQGN